MRVFLDTNVLVAAFATRGLCADVLRLTLRSHELVTSGVVLDELERVLVRKLGVSDGRAAEVRAWLEGFVTDAPATARDRRPRLRLRDASDVPVVESAVAARADLLVTGDADLLEADLPIRAVSPRAFWEMARAGFPPDEVHER